MPWIETENLSLHVAEEGHGDPPLILIHEMGGSLESWRLVIARLARSRRTIAVDLRGAGQSEKPRQPFELVDLADDLAEVLGKLGHPIVDIAGAAMGSVVATTMAIRHNDRVRRLVLCNVTDSMPEAAREHLRDRISAAREGGMRAVAQAALAGSFPSGFDAQRAAYLPIFLSNDPHCYGELAMSLVRFDFEAQALADIRCPSLVIAPELDAIWPPASGQRVASRIPGAEFALLPDAAHLPHVQCPEPMAAQMESFLERDM